MASANCPSVTWKPSRLASKEVKHFSENSCVLRGSFIIADAVRSWRTAHGLRSGGGGGGGGGRGRGSGGQSFRMGMLSAVIFLGPGIRGVVLFDKVLPL